MKKDLLHKYVTNSCSDYELVEVIRWINEDATNEEIKSLIFTDWKSYEEENDLIDDDKFGLLFDKIQHRVDLQNQQRIKSSNTLLIFLKLMTRVAAILLIPVLVFLCFTLTTTRNSITIQDNIAVDSVEVIAPLGSRTVVLLSDGSKVHLNHGSKIKYPQNFSGDFREVMLTGEGYFEIVNNPEKPFIVRTEKLTLKALGTAFNIMAYLNKDVIETTLVNGKLVLKKDGLSEKNTIIGKMEPGHHLNYNYKTGSFTYTKENIYKYIAWKDGKLVFDETSILEVADKLSRIFNVTIEIDDEIKDFTYTVTFIDESLFQILDLISIATPVKYKALPREKLPDGTFSKQKIIFEKN